MSEQMRSWRLHRRTTSSEQDLARWLNPIVSGWMNYYGRSYRSELYPLLRRINAYLVCWMRKKYKRLRTFKKALAAWERTIRANTHGSSRTGDGSRSSDGEVEKSPVTGDCLAGTCGSPEVRSLGRPDRHVLGVDGNLVINPG
jgi:hypothetical protein